MGGGSEASAREYRHIKEGRWRAVREDAGGNASGQSGAASEPGKIKVLWVSTAKPISMNDWLQQEAEAMSPGSGRGRDP